MSDHDCPGDDCRRCEARIEQAEAARADKTADDYDPGLDWHYPVDRVIYG